jgi:hypothetical protein
MLRPSDLKSDRLSSDTSDMLRPSDLKSDRLSCDTSDMLFRSEGLNISLDASITTQPIRLQV